MSRKMLINATAGGAQGGVVEEGRLEPLRGDRRQAQTRATSTRAWWPTWSPASSRLRGLRTAQARVLQIAMRNDLWDEHQAPAKGLPPLQELLKKGRQLLVQVVKEETGNKAPPSPPTCPSPAVPGGHPGALPRGVSRQIADDKERAASSRCWRPGAARGPGVIARTAREGTASATSPPTSSSCSVCGRTSRAGARRPSPAASSTGGGLAVRTVRDLSPPPGRVLVDARGVRAGAHLRGHGEPPAQEHRQALQQQRPIFGKYDVEEQISSVYQPAVRLASEAASSSATRPGGGGRDSGKAAGGASWRDTALAVNLEAAARSPPAAPARPGRVIVIDFIDMPTAPTSARCARPGGRPEGRHARPRWALSRFGLRR